MNVNQASYFVLKLKLALEYDMEVRLWVETDAAPLAKSGGTSSAY